jgi:tRNA dimethylallyltransferase
MQKLLCIVGPTGTGKTKRAILESSKQPSILISADSRQVYREMDIVTGKDHPKDVEIFGIDLVSPEQDCSVSVWYDSVMPHLRRAWSEGKVGVVVGGTGLYVKALTDGVDTMHIGVNDSLRKELEPLSLTQLQQRLIRTSQSKYDSMNHSDRCNPRRLIRAIEVGESKQNMAENHVTNLDIASELIGLNPPANYRELILARVLSRLELGAIEETEKLLSKYGPNRKSLSALGYKSIISHLNGDLTPEQMIESWVSDELAYAKRQLTWFRKQKVIWYDVGK